MGLAKYFAFCAYRMRYERVFHVIPHTVTHAPVLMLKEACTGQGLLGSTTDIRFGVGASLQPWASCVGIEAIRWSFCVIHMSMGARG